MEHEAPINSLKSLHHVIRQSELYMYMEHEAPINSLNHLYHANTAIRNLCIWNTKHKTIHLVTYTL